MRILAEDKSDFAYNHYDDDDVNHKSSPTSPFSPLLLIESLSRKSFSYAKLPLEPIKLTVVKLDASSFDISVGKNPTVSQLKQAVEDAFTHLPKHGIGKVSWSHVWAHFCLCYHGHKLLHDHDNVSLLGIKDGDQVEFVRHTSISYNLVKEISEKRDFDLDESKASQSKQEVLKHTHKKEGDDQSSEVKDDFDHQNHTENEEESGDEIAVNITCQCSWAHLFRRLFSYRRQKVRRTSYQGLVTSGSS